MKKWMILAAAILVVLGIGFAVKGASDRKPTVQPSETALPEATAEPEQAALTDETQTEDGMTQVYMLHGQITEITDEYLMLEGTEQGTVQVNLLDDTLRRQADALHPRAGRRAGGQHLSAGGHGG